MTLVCTACGETVEPDEVVQGGHVVIMQREVSVLVPSVGPDGQPDWNAPPDVDLDVELEQELCGPVEEQAP